MTWTYLSSALSTSTKDYVRFRVGDTTTGDQLLQDEEINAIIAGEPSSVMAAAICAESIAGWFARKVDKSVGRFRLAHQQASQSYMSLAKRLRLEAAIHVQPYAGAVSQSEHDSIAVQGDRPLPAFRVGMTDYKTSTPGSTDLLDQ